MKTSASALPDPDPTAPANVRDAAKVVGWGLVFWGGAQLAAAALTRNATAVVAVQAALAEWGAGRMGIPWSDPLAPVPTWRAIGRRVGRGAAVGAAAAVLVIVGALMTRGATLAAGSPALGLLAVGLVLSVLSAVRDELLLRGVVLRATRGLLPAWAALLACGGAAAAARYGVDGAGGLLLVAEGLRGVALGALWVRDRGAWTAVAANAAWTLTLGPLVRGALVDVRFAAQPDAGLPALVVLALAALAASAWARRIPPVAGGR
jgi:hypothetical protein